MALFGKKKEENKNTSCACSCGCSAAEENETGEDCCCEENKNGIYSIKVLGAGCKSCHELYENVKAAAKSKGLSVEVEYITEMEKIMQYNVMSMPVLVVNDKIVSVGKVLKKADIEKLIQKFS